MTFAIFIYLQLPEIDSFNFCQDLQPSISCPVTLLPLLHTSPPPHPNPVTMAVKGGGLLDGALPDLVLEMGYHFTNSVEECRASLLQLGGREVYASTVAKVLQTKL